MAPNEPHKLAPLSTNWHNRSHSSVNSDAATFHSAQGPSLIELETQQPPTMNKPTLMSKPKLDREDSGFAEGGHERSSSISTSNSRGRHRRRQSSKSPRHSHSTSRSTPQQPRAIAACPSRPSPSHSWRAGAPRPPLHARHTTPYVQTTARPYQFFQFPPISISSPPEPINSSSPSSSTEQLPSPPLPSPPPVTVQYWTSDSTRRLEYAAIDAASRGVRGLVVRLLPDCFLPSSARRCSRQRFHNEGEDDDSDVGSVRRYRLSLPEEKDAVGMSDDDENRGRAERRPRRLLRRWTTFGLRK